VTPEELAGRIAAGLLTAGVGRAAASLAQNVVGSARQRAFRSALRAAVKRFVERYPRVSEISADDAFFTDAEVLTLLFEVVMHDDLDALSSLSLRFTAAYDDLAIFGTSAANALRELAETLDDELSAASILAHQRDRKYFRRIEQQLEQISSAIEGRPLAPVEALAAARRVYDRLIQWPGSAAFSSQIVVDKDMATLALRARPGVEIVGRVTFSFPDDEDGRRAATSLRRAIETGTDASIPRKYISAFEARANGEPFPWGEQLPELVTLRAGPPNPFASRLSLYRSGRLLAAVDAPHLQRIRGGTRETRFETTRGRALELELTLRVPPDTSVTQNLQVHFDRMRDAREGWPLMQFLLCASEADRLVWERLDTGDRLTVRPDAVPAPPAVSTRYLAHLKALWLIENATGITMRWPYAGVAHVEVRRTLRVARALRVGAHTTLFHAFDIELDEAADLASIMRDADAAGQVSLNILEPKYRAAVGGAEIDIGPVFHWFPTVNVEARGTSLHVTPGSDRRTFQIFVRYEPDFEVVQQSEDRKVIFSEANAFPLSMLGLRRRRTKATP